MQAAQSGVYFESVKLARNQACAFKKTFLFLAICDCVFRNIMSSILIPLQRKVKDAGAHSDIICNTIFVLKAHIIINPEYNLLKAQTYVSKIYRNITVMNLK